jgi:predicted aspartyl protease
MLRKFIVTIAAASFLTVGALSAAQKPGEKPQVIKLERFRKALWKVDVTINGKSGDFLLDTGGGNTLLTEEYAASMKCRFWGRTTGYNMFGKRADGPHCDNVQLKAGDVALTPVSVGTIDFGDRFAGDGAPDGLLSLDAFDGKAITLNQVSGTLTIETSSSLAQRTKGMQELPFRISRECSARCLSVFVGVPTSDGMTWLILDSGAGGVSLIAKEYASAFGLDPARKEQRLKYDVAPGVPVDSPVVVTDMIMDGNLGQPFMSQYIITLDLARSRLWIARDHS